MALTFDGPGFTTELETEPSAIRQIGAECGLLGFSFADFTYGDPGRAIVSVTGAQAGVCMAPSGVSLDHGAGAQTLFADTAIARTAGSLTESRWTDGFRGQFFVFAPEAVERFFHTPMSRIVFVGRDIVEPARERPVLAHLVGAVSSDLDAGGSSGPLFIESVSAAALRTIVRAPETRRSPAGLTSRQSNLIRSMIHERYAESLSLIELADAVGLSVGHMLRAFKLTFGVTPHQYIIRERIEAAGLLLKTTTKSLEEVALASGFETRARMSRTFRSVLGKLPKDMR